MTSSKERTPPGLYYSVENGAEKHSIGRALSGDIMASDVESSTSLSSAGDLSLTCSFSPLESEESAGEESEDAFGTGTVEPYAYEPVASDSSESVDSHDSDSDDDERLQNTDWLVYTYINTL